MIKKITAVLLALSMALSLCSFEVFSVDTAGMDVAWELASPVEEIGTKTTETLFGTDHSKFIAAINTEGAVLEITVTNPSDSGMMTNIFADAGWSNAYVCAGKDQYPSKGTYTYTVTAAELMEQFSLTEISNMRLQFGVYGDESVKVSLDSAKVYVPASTGDEPEEPLETTLTLSANDYGVGSNWQGTYEIPIDGVTAWETTIEELLKTVGSLSVSFEVGSVTVDGKEFTDGVQFCGVMQTNDSTTGGWHDEVYTADTLKAGDKVDINFGNVGKILVNDDSASTVNPIINAMISSENYPITEAHDFKVTLKNIVITVFPPLDEDVDEDAEEIILPYVKFGENDGDYNHNGLVTLTPEDLGLSGDRVMAEDVVNANIDRIIVSFDFVDLKTPSGISLDPSDLLVPYVYNIQNGEGDDWSNSIWYSDWANVATVDENGHVTVDMRDLLEQLDGKAGEVQISWDPTVVPEYYSGVNDSLTLYVKNVTIEYFEPGAEIHKITEKGWKEVEYEEESNYGWYDSPDESYPYEFIYPVDASGEYIHVDFDKPLEHEVIAYVNYLPVQQAPEIDMAAYIAEQGEDPDVYEYYPSGSIGSRPVDEYGNVLSFWFYVDRIKEDLDINNYYIGFSVAVPEGVDNSEWRLAAQVENTDYDKHDDDDISNWMGFEAAKGETTLIFSLGELLAQNPIVTDGTVEVDFQIWDAKPNDFVDDIKECTAYKLKDSGDDSGDDEDEPKTSGTITVTADASWYEVMIANTDIPLEIGEDKTIVITSEDGVNFNIGYNVTEAEGWWATTASGTTCSLDMSKTRTPGEFDATADKISFNATAGTEYTFTWKIVDTAATTAAFSLISNTAAVPMTISEVDEDTPAPVMQPNSSEIVYGHVGDTCLNIKIDPSRTISNIYIRVNENSDPGLSEEDAEAYEWGVKSVRVYNAPSSSGKGSGKSNYPGYVVQLGEEYHGFFMGGFMITMPHTFVGDECTQCGYIRPTPAEDSAE